MDALLGFPNARDLGGLPYGSGGRLLFDRLIRAATPSVLSEAHRRAALSARWELIIDLRSDVEVTACPHPLSTLRVYKHLPLIDPSAEAQRDPAEAESVAETYQRSLSRNSAHIASILRTLAHADDGPVLVCCSGGRDRTGMICALWLDVAGVERRSIVDDYMLSQPRSATSDDGDPRRGGQRDIEAMLDHLDATWGSTARYLSWLGLNDNEIQGLVTHLTNRQSAVALPTERDLALPSGASIDNENARPKRPPLPHNLRSPPKHAIVVP